MSFFKKIKRFIKDYWEVLVGIVLVAIGYLLGTGGNREDVLKKDSAAQKKASDEIQKGTDEAIEEFKKSQDQNLKEKIEKEKEADQVKKERKEELLNDDENLDKILKEKYNLNGE